MGGKTVTSEKIGKIKKLLNNTKLKQSEIAEIVEVSKSTVSRVKIGYYDENITPSEKETPWHIKYKEVMARPMYDVVCQVVADELDNE